MSLTWFMASTAQFVFSMNITSSGAILTPMLGEYYDMSPEKSSLFFLCPNIVYLLFAPVAF